MPYCYFGPILSPGITPHPAITVFPSAWLLLDLVLITQDTLHLHDRRERPTSSSANFVLPVSKLVPWGDGPTSAGPDWE